MKKRVLVTGGSRGIGATIVKVLKKSGYEVIAPQRKELNLLEKHSIENYIKKNNNFRLHALINNAGINYPQWIEELTDENLENTIQTNLIAPIMLTRGFVSNLQKSKISHIVNIGSMFGVVARAKQTAYVSSKFGLNGATKALALELAPKNILVNSICPGFTQTELTARNSKEKNDALAKEVPLRRFAQPVEIANLVEFLISKNSYITGEVLVIDGGYSIR